jgi:K+-transporting ATPase ATPase C chain
MLIALTTLTGGAYPMLVAAIAQLAFPRQAHGSLIQVGNQTVGSELVGQSFTKPEYFWGRLSATAPAPYNAAASSGSNFGPLHPALPEAATARIASLKANGVLDLPIPVDLITASASGLDPHISPASADLQAPRVATARKMDVEALRSIVRQHSESRQFGVLGEPRVNVLRLNMALDQLQQRK